MYFVQRFSKRHGVSKERMRDIFKCLAKGWQEVWPTNHLVGLFERKWGVGAEPDYLAIWEIPNAAALDEWDNSWEKVKEKMLDLEEEFWDAIIMVETKLMEKVEID